MRYLLKLILIACAVQAPLFASYEPLDLKDESEKRSVELADHKSEQEIVVPVAQHIAAPAVAPAQIPSPMENSVDAIARIFQTASAHETRVTGYSRFSRTCGLASAISILLVTALFSLKGENSLQALSYQVKISNCYACAEDRTSGIFCDTNAPTVESLQETVDQQCPSKVYYSDEGVRNFTPATIEIITLPEKTLCPMRSNHPDYYVAVVTNQCHVSSGDFIRDDRDMSPYCFGVIGECSCSNSSKKFEIRTPICPNQGTASNIRTTIVNALSPYINCPKHGSAIGFLPCKASDSGQCQSLEEALKPIRGLCSNNSSATVKSYTAKNNSKIMKQLLSRKNMQRSNNRKAK